MAQRCITAWFMNRNQRSNCPYATVRELVAPNRQTAHTPRRWQTNEQGSPFRWAGQQSTTHRGERVGHQAGCSVMSGNSRVRQSTNRGVKGGRTNKKIQQGGPHTRVRHGQFKVNWGSPPGQNPGTQQLGKGGTISLQPSLWAGRAWEGGTRVLGLGFGCSIWAAHPEWVCTTTANLLSGWGPTTGRRLVWVGAGGFGAGARGWRAQFQLQASSTAVQWEHTRPGPVGPN